MIGIGRQHLIIIGAVTLIVAILVLVMVFVVKPRYSPEAYQQQLAQTQDDTPVQGCRACGGV